LQSLVIQVIILAILAVLPVATQSLRFMPIRSPIEITIQKNSPPYQAFKHIYQDTKQNVEKASVTAIVENLSTENSLSNPIQAHQNIVLLEPVIIKKFKAVDIQDYNEPIDSSWISSLPLRQRVRLEEAQSRYSILETKKSPIDEAPAPSPAEVKRTANGFMVKGHIEISGGLALTNDHYISLRRSVEGTPREAGEVSIKDGTYRIQIDSLVGNLIAKMFTKEGRMLGEGFLRLASDISQTGTAPTLVIRPQVPWSGGAQSAYTNRPPENSQMTAFRGETPFDKKSGSFQLSGVSRDSATVVRATAPEFAVTNAVLSAGDEFKTPLFPMSMVKALKEIVSEQMSYDLNDPDLPVIWGQVMLDGKPISGVTVAVEGLDGARAVYFDALNLPDVNVKETTANGYFAIIGVPEGFHALVANRGQGYYGHGIAVAEIGTVSLTKIESSLKTKDVPVRVFDAFTGAPQPADIEMQSLESPLEIGQQGWTTVLLPEIARYSLMQVVPDSNYIPAQYFYRDNQEFIHVPLVSEDWIKQILQPKWEIIDSNKGTVVGFFPHEAFEVFLAGEEDFPNENITFFDSLGNQVFEGIPGGGFIINNIEPGTHEVVVFGKESEKIRSRIIPIDPKSVSVITFQEY
jgi:hypothetical protein